jgi:hypothetical protein
MGMFIRCGGQVLVAFGLGASPIFWITYFFDRNSARWQVLCVFLTGVLTDSDKESILVGV